MWAVSFSIAIGSYTVLAASILGHMVLIAAAAITVATFTVATKRPKMFLRGAGRRADGEHDWVLGLFLGLILFYSINPEDNENLENIKNTGTFVGLTGIGVAVAGILLFLINRNPQPINENYDTK